MELRQLEYFTAVVETGTVSAAARQLSVSQPPVTVQLHALETELGCALFERAGRRLRLTGAGEEFYARASAILSLCRHAKSEMSDLGGGASGVLRVGAVSSVAGTIFPEWAQKYALAYPGVAFEIHEENTYRLLDALRVGTLDVAIVRTPFCAPDLDQLSIRREPMTAAGAGMGLCSGPIGLAELSGHGLALYRRWETVVRARFEALSLPLKVVCVADSANMALAFARRGLAVALVPSSAVLESDEARPVDDDALLSDITAVTRKGDPLPACARLFIGLLTRADSCGA